MIKKSKVTEIEPFSSRPEKITLDLPHGLYRVLAIDAVIKGVAVEEVATEYIRDQVELHFELPEMYAKVIKEIYKGPSNKGRRKRKAAE